jgi:LysM repeat protein
MCEAFMTRETKIGLLVGLAFILVIGILLTDQHRAALDPAPADLGRAGSSVGRSVPNVGGPGNPRITVVQTDHPRPVAPVPSQGELSRHLPVTPGTGQHDGGGSVTPPVGPGHTDTPDALAGLRDVARSHGEDIVPAEGSDTATHHTPVALTKSYTAQSGDTVSRMAARFLGGNTRANRQAIIDANPDLKANPDNVVLGQSYVIPVRGGSASAGQAQAPVAPGTTPRTIETPPATNTPAVATANYSYTVKEGDNLWSIARDEVGDSGAVAAIKELNKGLLKGGDTIVAGMKLRLPAKPLASAN